MPHVTTKLDFSNKKVEKSSYKANEINAANLLFWVGWNGSFENFIIMTKFKSILPMVHSYISLKVLFYPVDLSFSFIR